MPELLLRQAARLVDVVSRRRPMLELAWNNVDLDARFCASSRIAAANAAAGSRC
jgi:hypothetical protein